MVLTVEEIERLAKRIRAARAVQNHAASDNLTAKYVRVGIQLHSALQKCRDSIVEADCCNNAQLLREMRERYLGLREIVIEWRLVAQELGVFSTASANGCDGGGGSCSPCAPAASFTEGRDA